MTVLTTGVAPTAPPLLDPSNNNWYLVHIMNEGQQPVATTDYQRLTIADVR
jgi:hypothetical protein